MEGFQWPGRLAPSALPGKVAAGGARKPPAYGEDNVLGGGAEEATSFVPTRPEEYRKVFGAASACSIPVLDLPPLSDGCGFLGCSALDYLDIFGGFDGRDFGVPYEELFFAAAEESGGIAAVPPPLPPPDDPTALPANACTARGSKEMGCLMQEIPVPGWPAGDIIGSSSSGVAHCLSDGAEQITMTHHMACFSSKDDPLNVRIHKNDQVISDICLYPSDKKETTNGQNLKKTVPSTSSCSRKKHPRIDMKSESRPSKSDSSASCISAYKQNESFISSDWLKVSRSNVFSAKLSDNLSLHEDFVEKKTEGKWKNDAAQSTVVNVKTENDLKVQCSAPEYLPTNEALFPCSSSDHASSSSPEFFPHHLTSHINLDALDARTTEANHFTNFMLWSPSGTSSQSSDYDNKVEEKHFNTMSKFMEVPPINKSHPLHASNSHSVSCWYQSYPDAAFLTVSDVILQTQPSQGPPPSRPPPARPPPCSAPDIGRTSANCPGFGISTGDTFTSHSFKQAVNDISLTSFDADVSGSSRAVVSIAAIKEAMELAQARVKSAKVSMERKDNLQLGLKSGISDERRSTEMDKNKAIQDNQRNREDIVIQLAEKDDERELETTCASCVSTEGIALPSRNQEDTSFNCIMRDESVCFREGNEMEPEEDRILFEQCKSKKSNIMQWTFEHADNEPGLMAVQEVHDDSGNSGKIKEVQQSDGCNSNQNKLKEIQEPPLSPEKDHHHNNAEPSIAPLAGIQDDVEHGAVAIQGEYKSKINEGIKEIQLVLDPRQAVLSGKQSQQVMFAPRQAILMEKQWHTFKAVPENIGAEWLDENVSQVHETKEVVNKEIREREVPKNLEEIERERRKLENNDRARIKLEEKEGVMMKMEEKKDRTRRDLEEKGMKRDLEEEKDLERSLEDEKERERMSRDAEDEKRKYRGERKEQMYKVEEKERRVTDEGKGKDGKQERSNPEEEEMEKSILDRNEWVKRKLEEEGKEGKKLEEKEGEIRKLVEELERRIEEEDGHAKLECESERVKIKEKEREKRRMQQQREMERKMMEGETELPRINSEVEKDEQEVEDRRTLEREALERPSVETRERAEIIAMEMVTAEREQRKLEMAQEKEEKFLAKDGYLSDMWAPDLQFQSFDASISNCQRFSESFDVPAEKLGGSEFNSFTRCKARMERHQRTIERMAIALAEKNMRDIIAQREQAERNRLAETLDADVRRWSNGKEGNLRALLSTLQYILGPESGWQPIPLTDVITAAAVKKAYRKAMLYVHPDKLQQRSANIQQKYVCEKVFDLLKEAWNRFNSEEW